MEIKPRAGSKLYNGIEIPINTNIRTSSLTRAFRIVCTVKNSIQILDTGEFATITESQMKKYL